MGVVVVVVVVARAGNTWFEQHSWYHMRYRKGGYGEEGRDPRPSETLSERGMA